MSPYRIGKEVDTTLSKPISIWKKIWSRIVGLFLPNIFFSEPVEKEPNWCTDCVSYKCVLKGEYNNE